MHKASKPCYRCINFQRYYIKGTKKFCPLKVGRCCKTDETVSSCDSCERWKSKGNSRSVPWMFKNVLNGILTDISAIRQIIEESENEELQ